MNIKKILSFISILVLVFVNNQNLFSQQKQGKYLVIFKDKVGTTYSIDKPEAFLSKRSIDRRTKQGIKITAHDLPPSDKYIDELKKAGVTVWYKSRWYNAALVLADSATALKIKALSFVKGFENNGPMDLNGAGQLRKKAKFEIEVDTVNFGNGSVQARMLGTQNLHNAGYKGNGLIIAVMDDGFNKVDKNTYMKHLFDGKKIAGTYDYVLNTKDVYNVGGHGNLVLSTMAANTDGKFVGTAPEASYLLLRTEDAPTEKIIEEANWLFAAEHADSVGVDVINTSLGYEDFDYAGYTHKRADFDGDKILITKAADWAAAAGILVCVSAGNAGQNGGQIGAPADADSVMAVGAVTSAELKSNFSSFGPTSDGRIKPDIAAMGTSSTVSFVNGNGESVLTSSNGTSFSGPIFSGFATCFWQANPNLKVMEVQAAIKKLGTQADNPDNRLGYGIPKYSKSFILGDEKLIDFTIKIAPNPSSDFLKINIPENWLQKKFNITISNITGAVVSNQENLVGNQNLNLANYSSGIYIGKISDAEKAYFFKFIKQ
jgi:serine protease AprX